MVRISDLSDELLIRVLSFLPTKVAVSTSILSKQWQFLWMWLPKLEFDDYIIIDDSVSSILRHHGFIDKNLPLHRAPVIESLLLRFRHSELLQPEKVKQWVGIAVSRSVRELVIDSYGYNDVSLPSSLYTCDSLTTLKLDGTKILVDVPQTVCLPSLKTLQLRYVKYSNEDSLRLLLSHCRVLEDLLIERDGCDNLRAFVVKVPSLQRLSLEIGRGCSSGGCVILAPSLKYLKIEDDRDFSSYLIKPMPKLEEAYIDVERDIDKIFESITSVRRLSLRALFNSAYESVYRDGIVFNQLEHLKLCIYSDHWSKILVWVLGNSPKLRVLNLFVDIDPIFEEYDPVKWKIKGSVVLFRTIKTFEFKGFMGTQEERDFLSFFFKHASCLKSTSIIDRETQLASEEI